MAVNGIGNRALVAATASAGLLGVVWWTKPKPYPPLAWSEQAKMFPDPISLGLGPFQYYCSESGATSYPSDARLKPGLDAPSVVRLPYVSGVRMFTSKDYEEFEPLMTEMRAKRKNSNYFASTPLGVPATVSMKRNLADRDFNSVVGLLERREIEKLIVDTVKNFFPDSSYHGLRGNLANPDKQMSAYLEDVLRARGLLFEAPWTVYDLSCGTGRHWPDARGVIVVDSNTVVWVNGEDHLEIVAVSENGDITQAMGKANSVSERIETALKLAKDEKNGYLTMKPENSGESSSSVRTTVSLPIFARHPKFHQVCAKLHVRSSVVDRDSWIFTLATTARTAGGLEDILKIEPSLMENSVAGEAVINKVLNSVS